MSNNINSAPRPSQRRLPLPIGGEQVRGIRRLATWLDSAFRIPGTHIRFGWDPIIGLLLPVVGDAATIPLKLAPLGLAWKMGAGRWLIARMLWNVTIDSTIGAIPIVGDVFDFFFKANLRNARLLATLADHGDA